MKISIAAQTTLNFALITISYIQETLVELDPVIGVILKGLTAVVSIYTILRLREQVLTMRLDRQLKKMEIEDKQRKVQEYFETKYNNDKRTDNREAASGNQAASN